MATIEGQESAAQNLFGFRLQLGIERRPDNQPAADRLFFPEARDQFAPHILGEVLADLQHFRAPGWFRDDGLGLGLFGLPPGDRSVFRHPIKDVVATVAGGFREAHRVQVIRRLGQGTKEGHFADRQFIQALIEIGLSSGGDAIGLGAHEDLVQIDF